MVDTDPVTQEEAPGARPGPSAARRQVGTAAVTAGALTVIGLPIGLAWSLIAPRAQMVLLAPEQAALADPESTANFTADVTLALLTMAVGAVAAIVAYTVRGRAYGTASVLGLAVGGVLGTLVAWQTGRLWGLGAARHAAHTARVGDHFDAALALQAKGVLVLGALVAVAVFGLIEGLVTAPPKRADNPRMITNPFPPRHPGAE